MLRKNFNVTILPFSDIYDIIADIQIQFRQKEDSIMWTCPKCETINNSDRCNVCGEPMPSTTYTQPLTPESNPYMNTMYPPVIPVAPPMAEPKKSKKGLIIGIVAGVVLLIVGVVLGWLIFNDSPKNNPQPVPGNSASSTTSGSTNTSNTANIPDAPITPNNSDDLTLSEKVASASNITLDTMDSLFSDDYLSEEELRDTFGDGPYEDGFVFFNDKAFHNIKTDSAYFSWPTNPSGSSFAILDFSIDDASEVEKLLEETCTLKYPKKPDSLYLFYDYENLIISANTDYTSIQFRYSD